MYNDKNFRTSHPLSFGLSMTAGTGIVLMIIALAVGVLNLVSENSNVITMLFALGVVLSVIGIGGWVSVTRPFANFDDINQPLDDGHGHGHAAHGDEHAIVAHEETAATAHESH